MAKIGIFGSSFDPITNVHLWTASTVAHRCKLDRVIFLPSSNQRLDKQMHISDEHRWNLIHLAIKGNGKFVADDYEMKQYAWDIATYFTMEHFKEKYLNDEVYFIILCTINYHSFCFLPKSKGMIINSVNLFLD